MAALVVLTVALMLMISTATAGTIYAQTPEPTFSESEAQNIDRMIMCPVCPAETIDQAQVEISFQMRGIVREMLADGKDREEILDFFVDRYGKDILAAPPKSGANLVAWLLPVFGVAAALIAVYFIIRSMTRRQLVPVAVRPVQDDNLAPYLQLVDRHLEMARGAGGSSPTVRSDSTGTSNPPGPAVESPGVDNSGPDSRIDEET